MEYAIMTPFEMTVAAAAATTQPTNSSLQWLPVALMIIVLIVFTVMAAREYEKGRSAQNQASPTVA